MKTINIQYHKTIVGEFIIGTFEGELCLLDYRYRKQRDRVDARIKKELGAEYVFESNSIIEDTIIQLQDYFIGKRKEFEIPLRLIGSDFQKKVWKALQHIPYGSTVSYLQLAKEIGNAKAVRAVANANGANAIGIIVPCHRVIASDGTLGGYAGGLRTKSKLLIIEKAPIMGVLDF